MAGLRSWPTPSRWTPCAAAAGQSESHDDQAPHAQPRACLAGTAAQALGLAPFVQFQPAKDAVSLTGGIAVDAADEPAVRRAVGDLAADLERVTRKRPAVQQAAAPKGTDLIPSARSARAP